MPCTPYKEALIEAATGGLEAQRDLRSHLADCADCRAAFEQERSLFAAIDGGLHVAANAEVPASLLPRVRALLDEQSAPRRIWATNWLVLAGAAVIVVAFLTVRAISPPKAVRQPVEMAVNPVAQPLVAAPPQVREAAIEPPAEKLEVTTHQVLAAKSHPAPKSLGRGNTSTEVLVPHDQEILLAEYSEQWSLHKHSLLLAQGFDATILSPLQVEPIQIDELGVKPLAEDKLK